MNSFENLGVKIVHVAFCLKIAELIGEVIEKQLELEKQDRRVCRNFRSFWLQCVGKQPTRGKEQ